MVYQAGGKSVFLDFCCRIERGLGPDWTELATVLPARAPVARLHVSRPLLLTVTQSAG